MLELQPWVRSILADPITKQPVSPDAFPYVNGILDARVFLKSTFGYEDWTAGQEKYEILAGKERSSAAGYQAEITRDRPTYEHYRLAGRILDCGGGVGTVREFLPPDAQHVSTDPWLQAPFVDRPIRKAAYSCLRQPLNFIAAMAEFQPFLAESFDWVHMRSMLDHVQIPDLVLLEAHRVLRPDGRVLIGLHVTGGKSGVVPPKQRLKTRIKSGLEQVGIERWKDPHIWHPTYAELLTLIRDNGFQTEDTYWQENSDVCYICARKAS